MTSICPQMRFSVLSSPEEERNFKKNLLLGFKENKVTKLSMIKEGLVQMRCNQSPFGPSIGQFIGWCIRSQAHSMPSLESLYFELCRHTEKTYREIVWSHYIVWDIWMRIDKYFLRRCSHNDGMKYLASFYKESVMRYSLYEKKCKENYDSWNDEKKNKEDQEKIIKSIEFQNIHEVSKSERDENIKKLQCLFREKEINNEKKEAIKEEELLF